MTDTNLIYLAFALRLAGLQPIAESSQYIKHPLGPVVQGTRVGKI
jgi:hypothetical protein